MLFMNLKGFRRLVSQDKIPLCKSIMVTNFFKGQPSLSFNLASLFKPKTKEECVKACKEAVQEEEEKNND